MVDHDAAAGRQQGRQHAVQARGLQVHFNVPVQGIDAGQQHLPRRRLQRGRVQAEKVQTDADHAGVGQGLQFGFAGVLRHDGHAAQAGGSGAQRLDQMAVVRAQETRLHQDAVGQAVRVQQPQVLGQRGVVVGRVTARVGQGEALVKHVGVGVDGGAWNRRGQSGLLMRRAALPERRRAM